MFSYNAFQFSGPSSILCYCPYVPSRWILWWLSLATSAHYHRYTLFAFLFTIYLDIYCYRKNNCNFIFTHIFFAIISWLTLSPVFTHLSEYLFIDLRNLKKHYDWGNLTALQRLFFSCSVVLSQVKKQIYEACMCDTSITVCRTCRRCKINGMCK